MASCAVHLLGTIVGRVFMAKLPAQLLCVFQVEVEALPVYGVGHSMGSLLHMLINARYAIKVSGSTQQAACWQGAMFAVLVLVELAPQQGWYTL